jgi:hypothetical protein
MDQRELHHKIDKLQEDITEIKVTMARNTESLEHHMRRTDALESIVDILRSNYNNVQGVFKLLGILGIIAGVVLATLQIMRGL